jgi:hypothetical protein
MSVEEIPKLVFPKAFQEDLKSSLEIAKEFYEMEQISLHFIEIVFNICEKDNLSYFFSFEHLIMGNPKVQKYLEEKEQLV